MGVAVGDFHDSDGLLDIFKTNFAGDLPVLYRNLGKGIFEDATRESGASLSTTGSYAGVLDSKTLTTMDGRTSLSLPAIFIPTSSVAFRIHLTRALYSSFLTLAKDILRSCSMRPAQRFKSRIRAAVLPTATLTMMVTSICSS